MYLMNKAYSVYISWSCGKTRWCRLFALWCTFAAAAASADGDDVTHIVGDS